ncbi:MAG: hypothetical protein AB3N15_10615 [Paracoccaceae bacterium]
MKIKSLLNRMTVAKPVQPFASEDAESASSAKADKMPLLKKSELTVLFQAVLEEKRQDLTSRRG